VCKQFEDKYIRVRLPFHSNPSHRCICLSNAFGNVGKYVLFETFIASPKKHEAEGTCFPNVQEIQGHQFCPV
jgi:hypothetical protein